MLTINITTQYWLSMSSALWQYAIWILYNMARRRIPKKPPVHNAQRAAANPKGFLCGGFSAETNCTLFQMQHSSIFHRKICCCRRHNVRTVQRSCDFIELFCSVCWSSSFAIRNCYFCMLAHLSSMLPKNESDGKRLSTLIFVSWSWQTFRKFKTAIEPLSPVTMCEMIRRLET